MGELIDLQVGRKPPLPSLAVRQMMQMPEVMTVYRHRGYTRWLQPLRRKEGRPLGFAASEDQGVSVWVTALASRA